MRLLMIATSFAALTSGCPMDGAASLETGTGDGRGEVAGEVYRPIIEAVTGRISGDIGPMSGLDHQATHVAVYDDGFYLSIETVVAMQDHAVMTLLAVSNGADLFEPGVSATFPLDDGGATRVTLLGCVGQDVDVYDEWDKPADEVDIDVSAPDEAESPGELAVDVEARWYDRDALGEQLATFQSSATRLTLRR